MHEPRTMPMNPARAIVEHAFACPYCGETITMLLDLSAGGQSYVEDCEVCCRPIGVDFEVRGGTLAAFDARRQP